MKRLLLSLLTIGIVGVGFFQASRAFFADSETSTGNTFVAGAIDLKIDSTSHYAGMICALDEDVYIWQDEDADPENNPRPELLGDPCTGSWTATDLDDHVFFDFEDIKPGDQGENTLSLHVDNNDAWMCADVSVTENDDVTSTEPELEAGDVEDVDGDLLDGELAQNVNVTTWLDQGESLGWQCDTGNPGCEADPGEGDNVWQGLQFEPLLFSNQFGPISDVLNGQTYALADSTTPFGPIPGGQTNYIGVAWCAGTMNLNSPTGPITCDGAGMGNIAQTDSLTTTIAFRVEQARNNDDFVCEPPSPTPTPTGATGPTGPSAP